MKDTLHLGFGMILEKFSEGLKGGNGFMGGMGLMEYGEKWKIGK